MMMTGRHAGDADSATEDKAKRTISARCMDESGQGTKRGVAVAEAIAGPLRIQPSIYNHCRLLLLIGQLLWCCSYKSYNLHSVLQ
jgi:hypothetical protein